MDVNIKYLAEWVADLEWDKEQAKNKKRWSNSAQPGKSLYRQTTYVDCLCIYL